MPENKPADNQAGEDNVLDTDREQAVTAESAPGSLPDNDLMQKLTEMQDKYIRLSAEFDNYRKRTLREKIELTKIAGEGVLITILPVVDDFERARNSLQSTDNCEAVREGLELIYSKLTDFLRQNGVREMEVMNSPFDGDMHEAVTNVPVADESQRGLIIDVVQKGYTLNEKVIRFPKVVVGE